MISGSVIIYQQLDYALHTDLGFNKDQVLTFHIDDRKVRTQLPALKNQLLQSPLVEGVAAAGNPIGNNDLGGMGYYFQNEDGEFSTSSVMAQELVVDADYVPTLDIKLVTGRNFSDANKSDQFGGALVNETLVKKVGWKNAVGKTIRFRVEDTMVLERTVIGVVKDFNTYSLQHTISPLVMVMPPVESMKDNLYVKLASGNIQQGLAYLDRIYKKYDPSNKVEYNFLNQNFARQYESEERQGKIALMFTVLAVLIACLGLFGLAAFTTAQRKKEIGVRKVLGASVLNIVHMLSIDFLKLVALAAVISSPVAWFLMKKWLEDFAYRIDISWTVFMFSAVLAALIALLTVSFQALRAAVANPVKSLKTE
jgi:putative ABC transport system permease protein